MVTIHLLKLCGEWMTRLGNSFNSFSDSQVTTEVPISTVKEDFEAFATEFESMIFKEESILLMILLESFTQDDWLQIAEESDAYGYAIIRPSEKWVPERQSFIEERIQRNP